MKLEGIDPKHQSLYCVLSVAEVHGFRMRLHFDGYSECYDFWINADSPFIFPVGWCEKNNKTLQPPKGNCIFSRELPLLLVNSICSEKYECLYEIIIF